MSANATSSHGQKRGDSMYLCDARESASSGRKKGVSGITDFGHSEDGWNRKPSLGTKEDHGHGAGI